MRVYQILFVREPVGGFSVSQRAMHLSLLLKLVVAALVTRIQGVDEFLRRQSILYGISSLTGDDGEKSTCQNHLSVLANSVDLRHVWALKGKEII